MRLAALVGYHRRMNFRGVMDKLLFWQKQKVDRNEPYALILLLREPHHFSKSELEAAGEKGWRKPFGTKAEPMYFVVESCPVTMLKAGTYVLHMQQENQPYLEDVEVGARQLPQKEQKQAWLEHHAWAALNLWTTEDIPDEEAYGVLARFVLPLGDANCSGVYVPRNGWMFPNNGAAEEALTRMIAGKMD